LEEKKERKNLRAQRRDQNLPPVKTKEKINVGDVLLYVPPHCVQGSSYHRTTATVVSINPKIKHKIELSTPWDKLEDHNMVSRCKILNKGKLISHPGIWRSISSYVLETELSYAGHSSTMLTRQRKQRMSTAISKSISKSPKEIQGLMESVLSPTIKRLSNTSTKRSNSSQFPQEFSEIIKEMIHNDHSFKVSVNDVVKTLSNIQGQDMSLIPSKEDIAKHLNSLYSRYSRKRKK